MKPYLPHSKPRRGSRQRTSSAASPRPRRLGFEPLETRTLLAVDATLLLGRPVIDGTVAEFDVDIDFAASAGEELVFFSLDTAPSSPSLIGPGPDFSAFAFEPASPLLDDWAQIGFFNDPFFESTVEFDDSLIAPLPAGVYTLGTLSVDFGAAGLSFGDIFTVSIEGFDTLIGVEQPGSGFRFETVSFDPGFRHVVPVSLSGPATVDEGDDYVLTIDTPVTSGLDFIIDWGDGQTETIPVADLPANGEVTHVYADGVSSASLQVDVIDGSGTNDRKFE